MIYPKMLPALSTRTFEEFFFLELGEIRETGGHCVMCRCDDVQELERMQREADLGRIETVGISLFVRGPSLQELEAFGEE